MKAQITDDMSLSEVRTVFHTHYPNLLLEFFERDIHGLVKDAADKTMVSYGALLGAFRIDKIDDGVFNIGGSVTVKDFEDYIDSNYCLHIRLSRRSPFGWQVIDPCERETLSACDVV